MSLTQEFNTFFKQLAKNNHKEWFDANRKDYEKNVKAPFQELVAEVIKHVKKIDPSISMEPKDAIFRINRDVRFSKDKSPYKLHMAAHISKSARKDTQTPGIYFQVSPEGLMIGSGIYEPEKEVVDRIRNHIADNLSKFDKLLKDKSFTEYFDGIRGEKAKKLPPELKAAAEKQPVIFNKQFYYWAEYNGEKNATRKDLATTIADHYKACKKMNEFFTEALK